MDKDMLANELYLMGKGVRDCCETTIGGTHDEIGEKLYDIEAMSLEYKYHVISFLLEKEGNKEYRSVFICKYNYQKILLTKLFNDIKPHSFIYEYMMGTLLGYSAASMEEFLMRRCTDNAIGMSQYTDEDKEEEIEEETDVSSDETIKDKKLEEIITTLNNYYTIDSKENPDIEQYSECVIGLYLILDQKLFSEDSRLAHIKKFIDVAPPQTFLEVRLFANIESIYYDESLSQEKKIESVRNALHKYLVSKKKVMEKSETKQEDNNHYSANNKEQVDVAQYLDFINGFYNFLNAGTLPTYSRLVHIREFIEITPPQTLPEILIHDIIKSIFYGGLSEDQMEKVIKNILHTYLSHKKKEMPDIEKPLTNFDSNAYHLLNIISQANTNDSDNILLIQKFIKQKPKRDDYHQKRLITNIANVLDSYHPMSDSRKVYYVTRLLEVYFGLPYYDDSTFKSDLKEMYYFFKNNKPKDCISKAKDLVNKYHRSLKDEKNKGMLTSIISNIDSEEAITIKRTRIMIDIEEFLRGDPKVVLEDRRKYVETVKKLKDTISSLTPSSDFFDIINVFLRIDAPCRHEKIFKNKMIATMHNPSLTKLGKLNYINLWISNYLEYINNSGY